MTAYRRTAVDGTEVFYREGVDPAAPTLLLLHGFPSSSAQYEQLMHRLDDRYHVIAPDYPGPLPRRVLNARGKLRPPVALALGDLAPRLA